MEASQATLKRRFAYLLGLVERAGSTFVRFPLSITSAIVAAAVIQRMIEFDGGSDAVIAALLPIVLIAILGIPLFYCLRVLGESRGWSRRILLAMQMAGLAALVAYYMVMPVPVKGADVVTFLLLLSGALLAATFLPFLARPGEENGFWQYNKTMFLRLAGAVLYSMVLYVGLSLALAACDNLLGFDLPNEIYVELWYWVAIVYNTWFFLAGIPEDVRGLQTVEEYPTALRAFAQYVLIPLVVLYVVLLLAYTIKIIFQWELPDGWVGYPVIGVSILGMLALLLVHPIRDKAENKWIVPYAKFFYWALFPLIVLIVVAIWTRIAEYGLTENRYLVVVATAWLLGIAIYFTFARKSDIRVIPITLCIVSVLSAFGPWGATSFAKRSQLGHLREILISEGLMVDGVVDDTRKHLEFEREKQISNIVAYIGSFHGMDLIRDWYAEPEKLPDNVSTELALQHMGLEYIRGWMEEPEAAYVSTSAPNPLAVDDFDFLYSLSCCFDDTTVFRATLEGETELTVERGVLRLAQRDDAAGALEIDLAPMLIDLRNREELDESYGLEESSLDAESPSYRLVIYVEQASLGGAGDSLSISNLSAKLLVKLK